jgi:nucleotide-binding universal stress UspA family protein
MGSSGKQEGGGRRVPPPPKRVRGDEKGGERRVEGVRTGNATLFCMDGSEQSMDALRWGAATLQPVGKAEIVMVVPERSAGALMMDEPYAWGSEIAEAEAMHEEDERRATERIQQGFDELEKKGIPRMDMHGSILWQTGSMPGAIGERVAEYAREMGADVVVVGSRGLGAVRRGLGTLVGMGSVSDAIAHQCKVPVLIVNQNDMNKG